MNLRIALDDDTMDALHRIEQAPENAWDMCVAGEISPADITDLLAGTPALSTSRELHEEFRGFLREYTHTVLEHIKYVQTRNPLIDKKAQFLVYWNAPVQARDTFYR
jgi:hypothetical protein